MASTLPFSRMKLCSHSQLVHGNLVVRHIWVSSTWWLDQKYLSCAVYSLNLPQYPFIDLHPRICWCGEAWEQRHQYQCFVWQSLVSYRGTSQQQSCVKYDPCVCFIMSTIQFMNLSIVHSAVFSCVLIAFLINGEVQLMPIKDRSIYLRGPFLLQKCHQFPFKLWRAQGTVDINWSFLWWTCDSVCNLWLTMQIMLTIFNGWAFRVSATDKMNDFCIATGLLKNDHAISTHGSYFMQTLLLGCATIRHQWLSY